MTNEYAFIPGSPYNWYIGYMQASIALMSAYIEQCEISNSLAITEFHKHKEVEVQIHNESSYQEFVHFREVDGSTFDAQDIYTNYFPNMNRHSTLVMVTSMFEKNLNQLCNSLNRFFELNQPFQKGKGSLLLQIKDYFHNVVMLSTNDELEKYWSDLMCLQAIRNNIVHNFGKLESNNSYLDTYIEENKNIWLEGHNDICLNHEFLKDLIPTFRKFCKGIQTAIRDKEKDLK